MTQYIAVAIPVFFVLIGLEFLVARWQGRRVYRFADTITDLGCGIGQQVTGLFLKGVLFAGYLWVFDRFALFELPASSPWTWLVAVVGVDFFYYWWHRASHVVNFMWAAHIVHHQSEDMNLAVALRQAWFTSATSWIFYLPLAALGVPPLVFLGADAFSTLYQFWIHTETIGKMGPLESVLNTPSHHRVHHAINPQYLERNYGAVSIVWDRMFGSFAEEGERPVYGILRPFASWNPVWANFHYFGEIVARSRRATKWSDRIRVWFADPGWDPATRTLAAPPPVDVDHHPKFDTPLPRPVAAYVAVQFVPVAAATFALLYWQDTLAEATAFAGAFAILVSILLWGGLLERRRWAQPAELVRLGVLAAVLLQAAAVGSVGVAPAAAAITVAVASAAWLLYHRRTFVAQSPP